MRFLGFDFGNGKRKGIEERVDLASQEIVRNWSRTAIWHVDEFHPSGLRYMLPEYVGDAAYADRPIGHPPIGGASGNDKLGQIRSLNVWCGQKDDARCAKSADRREVVERSVSLRLEKMWVERECHQRSV